MRSTRLRHVLLLSALAALPGCAGGDGPSALTLPGADALPDLSAIKPTALVSGPLPVGPPTEIYTRVARGILTCWFGASGPLKPDYIYHADAAPPSKGGASVIDIRTRDKSASDPRSIRAWRVAILPAPEGATLQIENSKLPDAYAVRLESDVRRWAAAEEGCAEAPVTAGWSADPAPAAEPGKGAKPKVQPASARTP